MVLAAQPVPVSDVSKGKMKEAAADSPSALAWITNYLLSVNDVQSKDGNSGFSEALARVMSFCFSEAQNEPFEAPARAATAQAGCNVSGERAETQADIRHCSLSKMPSTLVSQAPRHWYRRSKSMPPSWQAQRWRTGQMRPGNLRA